MAAFEDKVAETREAGAEPRVEMRPEQRKLLRAGVLAAAVVALIGALILVLSGQPGTPAPPQHDVLMYMQYARAIAEGRPYEYQLGDPPSTGSTSHLYPALLSVFYKLGFHGEALLWPSLVLNGVFFVGVIACVGFLAAALLPHLMWLALVLAIFSGPIFLGVLGQTDAGLFMVCALGVWTALLYRRPLTAFAAMTAAVWTRPEGALVAAALTLCGGTMAVRNRRGAVWLAVGLWGLFQCALVLLWNRWLTGTLMFHSLLGKGYWSGYSGWIAVRRAGRDLAHVITGAWFCAPTQRFAFSMGCRLLPVWRPRPDGFASFGMNDRSGAGLPGAACG